MGFGRFLSDRCAIYRYRSHKVNGITEQVLQPVQKSVACRAILRSTRCHAGDGRVQVISTYTLLLFRDTDIKAGDRVQVNGEMANKKPLLYKADKPTGPEGYYIRVALNEEEEL